jgi:hypothetical protein
MPAALALMPMPSNGDFYVKCSHKKYSLIVKTYPRLINESRWCGGRRFEIMKEGGKK